jgi:5-(carboxyamino)imidazole ribonucleotide synthase
VVGGGQLGRMIVLAAARLGYRCHVLTDAADSAAAQVTSRVTVAAYDDLAALEAFARAVDVITIEFENLEVAGLERAAAVAPVRPAPGVLAICQDRIAEKAFLAGLGVATAAWRPVGSDAELTVAVAALPGRAVLKTARFGYDGKGQAAVAAGRDAAAAWATLGRRPAVLEQFVPFEREVSVITARALDGTLASYVPVENRHRDHILAQTVAPAALPPALAAEAVGIAERIAAGLELVGLLAVEMFVTADGALLVNELAPRPHNSGHWTIDACAVSQFEQLVRAVCGLPLGPPERLADAVMDNLLGQDVDAWPELLREPGVRLHLYGKSPVVPGRKLGHVTRLRPR